MTIDDLLLIIGVGDYIAFLPEASFQMIIDYGLMLVAGAAGGQHEVPYRHVDKRRQFE